jgi:hypothetical protein
MALSIALRTPNNLLAPLQKSDGDVNVTPSPVPLIETSSSFELSYEEGDRQEVSDTVKKRQLNGTPPDFIEEIGGPGGLDRFTLDALKKLCKKIGCALPANANRASTCGALIEVMSGSCVEKKHVSVSAEEEEVHEVYLTGTR